MFTNVPNKLMNYCLYLNLVRRGEAIAYRADTVDLADTSVASCESIQ